MRSDERKLTRFACAGNHFDHRAMQRLDAGERPLRDSALGHPRRVFEHAAECSDEARRMHGVDFVERHDNLIGPSFCLSILSACTR